MTRALLLSFTAFIALMVVTMVPGCAGRKSSSAKEVVVLVGLQRTACFGRCPVYELSVLNTGEANLNVGRFCEEAFGRSLELGLHRAIVDVDAWSAVADLASDMGYDTLQTRYDDPMVTDLPANIITVNGKTVYNRYGGPNLNDLYARIERLIGTTDWKADPSTAR